MQQSLRTLCACVKKQGVARCKLFLRCVVWRCVRSFCGSVLVAIKKCANNSIVRLTKPNDVGWSFGCLTVFCRFAAVACKLPNAKSYVSFHLFQYFTTHFRFAQLHFCNCRQMAKFRLVLRKHCGAFICPICSQKRKQSNSTPPKGIFYKFVV